MITQKAGQDGLAMCNKGLSFARGNGMLANQVWERNVGRVDLKAPLDNMRQGIMAFEFTVTLKYYTLFL